MGNLYCDLSDLLYPCCTYNSIISPVFLMNNGSIISRGLFQVYKARDYLDFIWIVLSYMQCSVLYGFYCLIRNIQSNL